MQPKMWSISKHEKSAERNNRVNEKATIKPLHWEKLLSMENKSIPVKLAEIQFGVGIACHGLIVSKHGVGSHIASIQLYRTKCSNLITKVVSLALKSELKKDVAESVTVH